MRLLTICLSSIQETFSDLEGVNYDEKRGIDALKGITEDLEPLYNPGYTNAAGEVCKNEQALLNVFEELKGVVKQSKSLSETTFVNKQGTSKEGVEAVQSIATDVEALNQGNP